MNIEDLDYVSMESKHIKKSLDIRLDFSLLWTMVFDYDFSFIVP